MSEIDLFKMEAKLSKGCSLIVSLLIIFTLSFNIYAQEIAGGLYSQVGQTSQPASQVQPLFQPPHGQMPSGLNVESLTPAQSEAVQNELSKTGGQLTPEAIETLKNNPEFKDIKPEDIAKGAELLKKKEAEKGLEKKLSEEPKEVGKPEHTAEKGSLFDRYSSTDSSQSISIALKPFGYDLFDGVVLTPSPDLPVAADYMIGPGDEINILLWGRLNAHYNLSVSREGTILFPNVGALTVAGMTFEEAKKFLTKQAKNIVGAEINVTMGRLRSIQVFVLGEVKKPGAYTVSAMSTLTNALMAAGGPSRIGTLRRVELKRSNKTISILDFYDLLLQGDKSNDRRLQNGDVVFVPTVGALVGVAGNVKRPAIYELKEDSNLAEVMNLAGGIIPTAYTQQIQVERVQKNERRIVEDINAKESGTANNFKLQDADLVKVFSITDKDVNAVYLNGNVKRPGKYEIKKGMRLKDIIKDKNDLLNETYLGYALIKRVTPPIGEKKLIPVNLGNILNANKEENIELEPQDSIYVFSKWFFKDRPGVTIQGQVRKGGRFDLDKDMTVRDLVFTAGDVTKDVSFEDFELYRTNPVTKEVNIFKFNLSKAMDGDEANNVKLQDQDRVVIHSVWETTLKPVVNIAGEVNNPGELAFAVGMTIKDLVFAAGGLKESAYLDEAELASAVIKGGKSYMVNYQKIDLRKALAGDPSQNIILNPYDSLFIKKIPEWREEKFVEIKGEVVFPGRYVIKKGERLSFLIKRAGGYTDKAYVKGSIFTRESVRLLQQKQLEESIERLERQMLLASSQKIEAELSPEDAKQKQTAAEQKQALIAKLKAVKAKGRLAIDIDEKLNKFQNSPSDIALENGDVLLIPEMPSDVQVIGSVYNQTALIYRKDFTVDGYIRKVGGVTKDADTDELYVLKVDGTAISKRESESSWGLRWDPENKRFASGGFMSSRLDPGDTIVVPEKLDKIAWLKEIKDLTQILYQIAVTAGVLIRVL